MKIVMQNDDQRIEIDFDHDGTIDELYHRGIKPALLGLTYQQETIERYFENKEEED